MILAEGRVWPSPLQLDSTLPFYDAPGVSVTTPPAEPTWSLSGKGKRRQP